MMKRLTATALALALFSAAPQTAPASSLEEPNAGLGPRRGETLGGGRSARTFYIKERITLDLADRVLRIDPDRYDRIELNSHGGSLRAAQQIARFVRKNGLATHISNFGYCASACVLIFQAGVRRTAGEKAILILHSATTRNGGTRLRISTRKYINMMIKLGASPLLATEFPTIGDWILTSGQARELGIVQRVIGLS